MAPYGWRFSMAAQGRSATPATPQIGVELKKALHSLVKGLSFWNWVVIRA